MGLDEERAAGFLSESAAGRSIETTLDPYIEKDNRFSKIRQGSLTNAIAKMNITRDNAVINPITDVATLSTENLSLSLTDFSKLTSGLKTTTNKLLDAIITVFTESGANSPAVQFPLDRYMALCGLKDKKEARAQVKADLDALLHLTVSYSSSNDWDSDYFDVMISAAAGIVRGVITFEMSNIFFNTVKRYSYMAYPRQLWTLSPHHNPNSFYFLRKITEHKNMNRGKSNEDIISVRTLLASTPLLPKYEDIQKSGQVEQRIIRPFERDMNEIAETLEWSYYHDTGTALTPEEYSTMNYSLFSSLMLHIKWCTYPAPEFSLSEQPDDDEYDEA